MSSSRALSFGSVAATYERFRPGYPDALVDAVLAYAGRPVRTALEVGAGTGKATRAFAARGIHVTATDPDAAMLAELRRHVPPSVTTLRAAFEDLPLTERRDLVLAAASLHWTEPLGRWERMAALLHPEGTVASFGGQLHLADPRVEQDVRAARAEHLVEDGFPSPDGTADEQAETAMEWPGTELLVSDLFTDVRQVVVERRLEQSREEYVGHLSTISAYLQLSPDVRALVLDRIRQALPERVVLDGDLTLHLARRA
ncbi:class I SAM-dependent methyltransferase [Nocardioides sp. KIGAM211]|uniref:Class I SAM-dependent methyltransferase n=1 Tax=Nocardioides luti TaxID=2761101 RepID=A0A7X0RCP0_9ACTN|nr:class I SAM-dependent methyltransferase [Nocardioides luti]MBB6625801.1 class I SAM-dependent methyltransferase [Nocardioides luti]